MPGFFDNWGRPVGSSPDFASGFPMGGGGMAPGSGGVTSGFMPSWGMDPGVGMSPMGGQVDLSKIPAMGALGGSGSVFGGPAAGGKLGLNFDTANLAMSGLSTIGGLWGAFQAAKLAKKQFKYTKDVTETNMANQIKTYNTGLTDRMNNRAIVEGRGADETKALIDANSLRRYGR